jgi:two-component system sensor histidine kinase AlgZ
MPSRDDAQLPDSFLPDFCGIRAVFAVVVVGELLAIVLTLAPGVSLRNGFNALALNSLFVQWTGLVSCALLCFTRRVLESLGDALAASTAGLIVVLVTAAVSEAAWWAILPRLAQPGAAIGWELGYGTGRLGEQQAPLSSVSRLEFLLRNIAVASVVAFVALRYFYVQHQLLARIRSESQARIQALQSRIRPHFLFNSMNTIASLARSEPAVAEQVTEDLASLFRVSLGDARVPVRLEQELDLCRQYLRIEAQRLGERLCTASDTIGVPGDALLPALTLQPLLENAVYHGVEPAPDGGRIALSGRFDGERVVMRVENTVPPAGVRARRGGNAMALDNVAQRMEAFFAGEARVRVLPDEERYCVELQFPYRTEEA